MSPGNVLAEPGAVGGEILDEEVGEDWRGGAHAGVADAVVRELGDEEHERSSSRLQLAVAEPSSSPRISSSISLRSTPLCSMLARLGAEDEVAADDVPSGWSATLRAASWTIFSWVRSTPALPALSMARSARSQKRRRVGRSG